MNQQPQGDEAVSEEAHQGATQACGCSSDEEDEPAVSELRQIDVGGDGKVLQLPDGINFEVLAFGRDEQAAARGDGVRVVSVVLPDARPAGQKMISSLQAEVSAGEEGVSFKSLGKAFNFVNEVPLHAKAKKYTTSYAGRAGDSGGGKRARGAAAAGGAPSGWANVARRERAPEIQRSLRLLSTTRPSAARGRRRGPSPAARRRQLGPATRQRQRQAHRTAELVSTP